MIQITPPLQEYLHVLCAELASMRSGDIASYIPELSHVNPDWFGIAITTVDGHVYQAGETAVVHHSVDLQGHLLRSHHGG